eukprot:scaffold15370_cov15-Tisochrysis_lutea.AAC.1
MDGCQGEITGFLLQGTLICSCHSASCCACFVMSEKTPYNCMPFFLLSQIVGLIIFLPTVCTQLQRMAPLKLENSAPIPCACVKVLGLFLVTTNTAANSWQIAKQTKMRLTPGNGQQLAVGKGHLLLLRS